MRFAVFSPYWPSNRERRRNWGLVRAQFRSWGWPHFSADNSHIRPRNAAARLTDWDVGLFCDGDILLADRSQAEAALFRAHTTGAYTVAFSRLYYLTKKGTKDVETGRNISTCEYGEVIQLLWENCFAITKALFDEVGGFDERFIGYGGQATAFYYAASTLGGRERIPGDAYHLHHRLVNRERERHFSANMKLAERYHQAVDDPKAMRKILAER